MTASGSFWSASRHAAPVVPKVLEVPFFVRGSNDGMNPQASMMENLQSYSDFCVRAMTQHPKESWVLFIPYWLLWMAMGVVWVALLVWRRWRGRGVVVAETES